MARRTHRTGLTALAGVLLTVGLTACASGGLPGQGPPEFVTAYAAAGSPAAGSARAAAPVDFTPSPPATVEIDGAQPAPVRLADVDDEGFLAVPEDVQELGFWIGSTPMGSPEGTTLIAGHRDSAVAGLGYFDRLADVAEGDVITVVDGLGVRHEFAVTERQEVNKRALPREVYDTDGPRRLVLITCGGPFDDSTGNYRNNVVVWADPVV